MQTVLVAIDGSPPALKGVVWAAKVAKALGAKLELVYVTLPNLLPPHRFAKAIAEIDAAEAQWAGKLFDTAEHLVADFGLECVRTRRTGSPAEEISNVADREEVWGVVVGAAGHNAVSRMMLGSVADRLVHISPKPVLVVR